MVMPDPARSWACLIGVGTYPRDDGLDDLPAVPNNLDALHEILTDPLLAGLPDDHCVVIRDPVNAQELALRVEDVAGRATDMFLVYFAGHGLIDSYFDGRLYLATSHALEGKPHFTSLAYDDLRRAMLHSSARNKVVVLDCCFSGQAHGTMAGSAAQVAGQLDIRGTCVLTATKSNEMAKAPAGEVFTAYTGQLVDVLRCGVADGPELVDITTLHEQLLYRLRSAGLPEPRMSGSDTIGRLPLVRNASWRAAGAGNEPVDLADPAQVYGLGSRLEAEGHPEAAGQLYRRAISAGNTDVMLLLGAHHQERENDTRAERWYREAAGTGLPDGMTLLGTFLHNRGAFDEAESWYRKAAEAGQPRAAELLGEVLERRGDTGAAERWYRAAVDAGRTRSMIRMGGLLERRGEPGQAVSWYRRAVDAGDAAGWTCLGMMAAEQGATIEADAWLRKAAAAGEPDAMTNLGIRHLARNERAAGIRWFGEAAAAGSTDGMVRLGNELMEAGDTAAAERWFRSAAREGNGLAMVEIGKIREAAGDLAEAEDWYRRGVRAGAHIGVIALVKLLILRDRWDEAERVCRASAEAGRAEGMSVLGMLLEQRGDPIEARYWQEAARAVLPDPNRRETGPPPA
ncbi:caspase, EACC1-associated type [Nocardia rhamnosiphila]|uniref:caspase, EACC1-associated type n=1 Tax=Nocardia rhamnosiphila TaxID=426716 RepID=UPI0006905E48|nr:tetratricopeptide repeat protein [Nocardia rhamnosiphila]